MLYCGDPRCRIGAESVKPIRTLPSSNPPHISIF
jgi:hypothetical protein